MGVSVALLLSGVGLLAFPFATDMFANYKQGQLGDQFRSGAQRRAFISRSVPVGHALTRLQVPRLGVDTVVVEGITASALRAGSGHYPDTPLPCERGNAAIAGHRTTYSKPFAAFDRLRPGDTIVVSTPIGRCWYEVERAPWIIDPYDWSVVDPTKGSRLTLTTCNPPGSAAERLIVRAKLVRSEIDWSQVTPPQPGKKPKAQGDVPGGI